MKNKEVVRFLCLFGVALAPLLFSACNPVYYQPTPAVVPLLEEKGEFTVQGSLADGPSYTLSGAYAVTDMLGVSLHGYLVPDVDGYTGGLVEGGIGLGVPVSDLFRFETYGGAGFGSISASKVNEAEDIDTLLFRLNFSRLYLQPSFGFINPNFEAAVTTRLSVVNYGDIERGLGADDTDERFATLERLQDEAAIFFEPGLTVRGGTEMIKAQVQYVHAIKLSGDALEQGEDKYYRNSVLSLGLALRFGFGGE